MPTLKEVRFKKGVLSVSDYRQLTPGIYRQLKTKGRQLNSKNIIHISSTARGGGVAEMLHSYIPLLSSMGINAHWFVTERLPRDFFVVTKKIHNLLQGKAGRLSKQEKKYYLLTNAGIRKPLLEVLNRFESGLIMIHDPQVLPIIQYIPKRFITVLRFHIDLSTPNRGTLRFLKKFIRRYDNVIVSSQIYSKALKFIDRERVSIMRPAIDPYTKKNRAMTLGRAQVILRRLGIDTQRPILAQISRFDPWKDPIGVIRAYKQARAQIPGLQLVMAGIIITKDDPEAIKILKRVKSFSHDKDIFIFWNLKQLNGYSNETFINALLTASDVVVQNSIREGFGMSMTEAMWKRKPLIAGDTVGAEEQITDAVNGVLISSRKELADATVRLFRDRSYGRELGIVAHRTVQRNFLISRLVLDHTKLYQKLLTT